MFVIQLFYSATSIATDMKHEVRYDKIYIKGRLGGMRHETVVDSNQHVEKGIKIIRNSVMATSH
jgi:hypothetical protein